MKLRFYVLLFILLVSLCIPWKTDEVRNICQKEESSEEKGNSKQRNMKQKLLEVKKVTDFPRPASCLIYLKGKEAEKEDTVKNCQKTSDTDIKS